MALLPPPLTTRRVFVDSSANAALLDRDDEHHTEAAAIASELVRQRYRFVTTNVIVIEAHALILSSLGTPVARQFLRDIRAGNTLIIRASTRDEARAEQILFQYTDKEWSMADAISFAVMDRLGIRLAFTFDRDFTQYGFTKVTPDLLR